MSACTHAPALPNAADVIAARFRDPHKLRGEVAYYLTNVDVSGALFLWGGGREGEKEIQTDRHRHGHRHTDTSTRCLVFCMCVRACVFFFCAGLHPFHSRCKSSQLQHRRRYGCNPLLHSL